MLFPSYWWTKISYTLHMPYSEWNSSHQTGYQQLWHYNECNAISNHQCLDCLLNHLFRNRSKKTWKLHVTGLCDGNPLVTGGFPWQRTSNVENVSIWWRHHDDNFFGYWLFQIYFDRSDDFLDNAWWDLTRKCNYLHDLPWILLWMKSIPLSKCACHNCQVKYDVITSIVESIVPSHKDFSPSGEQLEHRKLAHEL